MVCPDICPREQISADPEVSPGPIGGAEEICRGAYDPMHFKKGRLKNSFIRPNDLLAGKLSVWRLSQPVELEDLVEILSGFNPPENHLQMIRSSLADDIRNLSIASRDGRVFSVIDDCTAFPDGGKHPAHAVIAICEALEPHTLSKESPLFEEIRNKIHLAFATSVWERAA